MLLFYLPVEARIHIVDVFLVQTVLYKAETLTEALEMHDLARPQELDDVAHVRIVRKTQDVVIRHASLLLCCNFVRTTFVFQQIQPCISAKLLTTMFQKRVFPDFVLQGSEEFGQASPM